MRIWTASDQYWVDLGNTGMWQISHLNSFVAESRGGLLGRLEDLQYIVLYGQVTHLERGREQDPPDQ